MQKVKISDQMESYLRALNNAISNYKWQTGTKSRPARSCRDLKLDNINAKDGWYYIDPNEGCSSDAQLVYCDFKQNETCVYPTNRTARIPKDALTNATDGEEKWVGDDIEIDYKLDFGQLKFLRLSSTTVKQNITYHCRNTHAWESSSSIKILTNSEEELNSLTPSASKPTVLKNECTMKDSQWRSTVLEIKTKKVERLPIVDVSPFTMDSGSEFIIELGPVCFA